MEEQALKEQTAIITGGTRGIGYAIVKHFLENGASIAVFGTNPERGIKVVEELKYLVGDGQKLLFYQVDVANAEQVNAAINQVFAEFGHVDILVNNAGINRDALLMKLTEEQWVDVIDTNLKSVYYTCRSVIRPMMKKRAGRIINITSVVGLMGNAGQTNYAASKSGMIGFTKSLAKELGSRGICVNCIAPGFIKTDMTDALSDAQRETLLKQIPLNKLGDPMDIAHAALFLASPQASYITGQVLTVDGGMVMQ
ncbi:MAG: 3-oxoacyl-ACP reductase FabG [Chlamydiales bacterium]